MTPPIKTPQGGKDDAKLQVNSPAVHIESAQAATMNAVQPNESEVKHDLKEHAKITEQEAAVAHIK